MFVHSEFFKLRGFKMIVKFTVITPKCQILVKPTITKVDDHDSIYVIIISKNYEITNIVEVLTGESFTALESVDTDCLQDITFSDLKHPGKTIHLKLVVNLEPEEATGESSDQPPTKKLRTLMDVTRAENYWPPYKNNDQVTYLSKYIEDFKQDSTSAIENLESYIMHSKVQSKILLYDSLLILFKQNCRGVFNENVNDFGTLCMAVRDLIWYKSPHADKFKSRSANLPKLLSVVQPFNDPR